MSISRSIFLYPSMGFFQGTSKGPHHHIRLLYTLFNLNLSKHVLCFILWLSSIQQLLLLTGRSAPATEQHIQSFTSILKMLKSFVIQRHPVVFVGLLNRDHLYIHEFTFSGPFKLFMLSVLKIKNTTYHLLKSYPSVLRRRGGI